MLFSTDAFLALLGLDPVSAFWGVVGCAGCVGIALLFAAVIREGSGDSDVAE